MTRRRIRPTLRVGRRVRPRRVRLLGVRLRLVAGWRVPHRRVRRLLAHLPILAGPATPTGPNARVQRAGASQRVSRS
ncbi:hypothetical protein UO65_2129 [Actinokineospora spheciospongiae]|uniref:Uncharacterized protein n=1 Tax=Actinokineospora spheciospongiae TaxID=909613 RepID=W7J932_9PSEU|nr:hypothetical protein UO65_2129 [Actinokineospora spheciospongiae]